MMEFAKQLKKYRLNNDLSQEDLATKLFVSRQAVSKWENGEGTPDLDNIVKLAEIFDVSLDALVLGIESESKQPQVDSEEFVYNPNTKLYERRHRQMNFWDFLSRYWWLVFSILGMIGWLIMMYKWS
ncbi:helix-turn-helix domain-containing protein [Pediococcus stilesii]|uniref:Helix-turn-helix domain-containing protein n=1 Tax=Pediococcus stilesii TaxID=331679 RepID=A0A5R9BWC3_9LACO|nr:helix-turn-helix domain-containing protein [Pediococcus stilesii]TLQ04400.1 helix-turn-helix domain-containing protein [Pediococcus stilesii]